MSRYLIGGVILVVVLLTWLGVESAAQFGEGEDFTEAGDDQSLTPLQQAGQLVERQSPAARTGLAEDATLTQEENQAQPTDTPTPTDEPMSSPPPTPTPTSDPVETDDSIPALW
ncbi:hypothetical protein XM38_049630 [Halomicronema hongdechloris C2206]|uniref:Uncharacterized protein n=1 Tax=Halomicronema hongdechloris C2206 TaxID=1641165 RepID=A0A1Z3HUL8_9CYAN|nr:hypothetical protein [Halomicronema hongdechloris]ASC73989.1 hypothetical protein XM38_049630 [Halomicronema hongdechloris C2206]